MFGQSAYFLWFHIRCYAIWNLHEAVWAISSMVSSMGLSQDTADVASALDFRYGNTYFSYILLIKISRAYKHRWDVLISVILSATIPDQDSASQSQSTVVSLLNVRWVSILLMSVVVQHTKIRGRKSTWNLSVNTTCLRVTSHDFVLLQAILIREANNHSLLRYTRRRFLISI